MKMVREIYMLQEQIAICSKNGATRKLERRDEATSCRLRFKNNYEIEKSQSRQTSGGSLISVHCNITTAELKNLRRFPFFPLSMVLSFRTKLARVAKDNC